VSNHLWLHAAHAAVHSKQNKTAGVMLLVVGFFLAPVLVGIPLMIAGVVRLLK
jgi:hypothetical protein